MADAIKMAEIISREIRLKNRPFGMPKEDDFELAEVRVPEIKDGEVLVRNIYMSVDPYMRGRMNERGSYAASFLGLFEGKNLGKLLVKL